MQYIVVFNVFPHEYEDQEITFTSTFFALFDMSRKHPQIKDYLKFQWKISLTESQDSGRIVVPRHDIR